MERVPDYTLPYTHVVSLAGIKNSEWENPSCCRASRLTTHILDTRYSIIGGWIDLSKHKDNLFGLLIGFMCYLEDPDDAVAKHTQVNKRANDALWHNMESLGWSFDKTGRRYDHFKLFAKCLYHHGHINRINLLVESAMILLTFFCDGRLGINYDFAKRRIPPRGFSLVQRGMNQWFGDHSYAPREFATYVGNKSHRDIVDAAKLKDVYEFIRLYIPDSALAPTYDMLDNMLFDRGDKIPNRYHARLQIAFAGVNGAGKCSICFIRDYLSRYHICEVTYIAPCASRCDSRCIRVYDVYTRLQCNHVQYAQLYIPEIAMKVNPLPTLPRPLPSAPPQPRLMSPTTQVHPLPSAPPDHLPSGPDLINMVTCQLCNDRIRDVALGCSHTFCAICVGKLHPRVCPVCRGAITQINPFKL